MQQMRRKIETLNKLPRCSISEVLGWRKESVVRGRRGGTETGKKIFPFVENCLDSVPIGSKNVSGGATKNAGKGKEDRGL